MQAEPLPAPLMARRAGPVPRPRAWLRPILLCLLHLVLSRSGARAQEPMSQMDHQSWTARDGAPQAISALAQAPNGLLWIGSQGGIFSFDGLSFTAFRPAAGQPKLPTDLISTLTVARDGSVWAGMMVGGVARIQDDHVTLYGTPAGKRLGIVRQVQQAPDGSIWCEGENKLARFDPAGVWHVETTPGGAYPRDLLIDREGVQWLATDGRLFRRTSAAAAFTPLPVAVGIPLTLVEAGDGTLLLSEQDTDQDHGRTLRLDRQGAPIGTPDDQDTVSATLPMPDGSVWLSTESAGLHRVAWDPTGAYATSPSGAADRFGALDGLAAGDLSLLLRDRDGDIWVGGRNGLDRFKPAWLQRYPQLSQGDADFCVNSRSEIWVLSNSKGLHVVKGDAIREMPAEGDIYRMACSASYGMLYIDPKGLWTVEDGTPALIAPIPGIEPYGVLQIVETADHAVSITLVDSSAGARTLNGTSWATTALGGVAGHGPKYAYVDAQGRLWAAFGLTSTEISVTENGHVRLLGNGQAPSSAGTSAGPDPSPRLGTVVVRGFAEVPQGMLAAGIYGLGFSRGGTEDFRLLTFADPTLARGLTGIARDRGGDVWLNGSRGIVRIRAAQLAAALQNPNTQLAAEAIHEGGIVGPAPYDFKPGNSVLLDPSGKLWFVTMTGVLRLDPAHRPAPPNPPVVAIRSILADGQPLGRSATLPPRPQTVEIRYFGLQLSAPEAVVYRYRLDGLDESWQNAGTRAEAIYTHLPPGKYVFRVEAANGDGNWTAPVASRSFKVRPSFYQTWWFLAASLALLTAALWLAVTLRLRAVGSAIRLREEGRADERIRIARDLHDTLLQGVQGLVMSVHAVLHSLSSDHAARDVLSTSLDTADRIIAEGRDRVGSLRAAQPQGGDLMAALQALALSLEADGNTRFSIGRSGHAAPLAPDAADEVLSIAREAMTNAARHANATEVDVQLVFSAAAFTLTCRDNGTGFDPAAAPAPGHWGLRGMTERTERLSGRLHLHSKPGQGTEVRLVVQARNAYASPARSIPRADGVLNAGAVT